MPLRTTASKGSLSRARVVDAALKLIDRYGLDAVSMRRVAAELGVEAMSLYNHVANKRELLVGVMDRVLQDLAFPAADDPLERAKGLARNARFAILAHPNVAPLFATNTALADSEVVRGIRHASVDVGAGFGLPSNMSNYFAIVLSFVIGHILLETATFPADQPSPTDPAWYDADASFELGLDALLSGLAAVATGSRHSSGYRSPRSVRTKRGR